MEKLQAEDLSFFDLLTHKDAEIRRLAQLILDKLLELKESQSR